jgi:hypothetical protein
MKSLHQSPRATHPPFRQPPSGRLFLWSITMMNIVVLKAVDAHCWANMHMRAERIPTFSMARRCGSAFSRVIRMSPRAFRRWASGLCRGGSSRCFPSGTIT